MILYLFGWIAVHPPIRPVTLRDQVDAQAAAHAASEGFGNVSLTTADGTILKAWLLSPPSPNGGAVILLHGVLDNRLGVYGYGKWLLKIIMRSSCRMRAVTDSAADQPVRTAGVC